MNQTNKEERSSAEPGEKRMRAKENIVPSDTSLTQSGTTDSDYEVREGRMQTVTQLANAGSRLISR
jgi:hypothetical protein